MALLRLKNIGKIYVSEGNVAVGIRGVDLSFERGEFVAVTGRSGSGKSTLLNVISGIDSYEEGELLIDGATTSHYMQEDWERYRQEYISFIFQDYNIIESFTVLENVELALMHIESKKERRARALELIARVGLSSHVKHKGSKLSGGQKQRTVIARALAKDSPMILADEPTGNLDSESSKEIIELLYEVSKDKLVIIVTHNFEEVEKYATRHVRVFDGAIESDHVLRATSAVSAAEIRHSEKKSSKKKELADGFTLGKSIFTAKPRLSTFLCLLMMIGTLGIFLVTSFCTGATEMFKKNYMFTHIDGRLIVTSQSGEVIDQESVKSIAEKYGAKDYLLYDSMLDAKGSNYIRINTGVEERHYNVSFTYWEDYGTNIIGSYPKEENEVFLYLPLSYAENLGRNAEYINELRIGNVIYKVSGVKYFYDNNQKPKCLFTREGFMTATAISYLTSYGDINIELSVAYQNRKQQINLYSLIPSFELEDGKIYVSSDTLSKMTGKNGTEDAIKTLAFSSIYYKHDFYSSGGPQKYTFTKSFDNDCFAEDFNEDSTVYTDSVYISASLVREIAEDVLSESYKQVSLFFENDRAAELVAQELKKEGYVAVPSTSTYNLDAEDAILTVVSCLLEAFVWFISILFLAFFINLCSNRTLSAFKGEMAIMRSMGIAVKTIRIGMYVRMLISLIPAFILMAVSAFLIFTTPKLNGYFNFLYAWHYAAIVAGMLILVVRITHSQIRKLFGESVKKALRGGNAE